MLYASLHGAGNTATSDEKQGRVTGAIRLVPLTLEKGFSVLTWEV